VWHVQTFDNISYCHLSYAVLMPRCRQQTISSKLHNSSSRGQHTPRPCRHGSRAS
jgi:hypothetical protein